MVPACDRHSQSRLWIGDSARLVVHSIFGVWSDRWGSGSPWMAPWLRRGGRGRAFRSAGQWRKGLGQWALAGRRWGDNMGDENELFEI
jgi:hypothetical protein